mmetsp:Transcript_22639/g.57349  ORF Transcript_22639/g.57349 Transcript_22639/m.57349 type:complete len:640 (-) Transcript_22639:549-2468(-)
MRKKTSPLLVLLDPGTAGLSLSASLTVAPLTLALFSFSALPFALALRLAAVRRLGLTGLRFFLGAPARLRGALSLAAAALLFGRRIRRVHGGCRDRLRVGRALLLVLLATPLAAATLLLLSVRWRQVDVLVGDLLSSVGARASLALPLSLAGALLLFREGVVRCVFHLGQLGGLLRPRLVASPALAARLCVGGFPGLGGIGSFPRLRRSRLHFLVGATTTPSSALAFSLSFFSLQRLRVDGFVFRRRNVFLRVDLRDFRTLRYRDRRGRALVRGLLDVGGGRGGLELAVFVDLNPDVVLAHAHHGVVETEGLAHLDSSRFDLFFVERAGDGRRVVAHLHLEEVLHALMCDRLGAHLPEKVAALRIGVDLPHLDPGTAPLSLPLVSPALAALGPRRPRVVDADLLLDVADGALDSAPHLLHRFRPVDLQQLAVLLKHLHDRLTLLLVCGEAFLDALLGVVGAFLAFLGVFFGAREDAFHHFVVGHVEEEDLAHVALFPALFLEPRNVVLVARETVNEELVAAAALLGGPLVHLVVDEFDRNLHRDDGASRDVLLNRLRLLRLRVVFAARAENIAGGDGSPAAHAANDVEALGALPSTRTAQDKNDLLLARRLLLLDGRRLRSNLRVFNHFVGTWVRRPRY